MIIPSLVLTNTNPVITYTASVVTDGTVIADGLGNQLTSLQVTASFSNTASYSVTSSISVFSVFDISSSYSSASRWADSSSFSSASVSSSYSVTASYFNGNSLSSSFSQTSSFLNGMVSYINTKTSSYLLRVTDYVVVFSGSTSLSASLPDSTINTGRVYNIKNVSPYNLIVTGSQTIDNNSNEIINQWNSINIVSMGSQWIII